VTTGASSIWDFSAINIDAQRIDTFHDVSQAEALYQLVFNNGFTNPDYESDYYTPWNNIDFSQAEQLGLFISEPVAFTKISSSKVEITGIGIKANGISIPASSDTIDLQFELPMTFNDAWTSDSYTELDLNPAFNGMFHRYSQRDAVVDGWGQITTPFKTYDAIRVKSIIDSQDSVYIDIGGFGGTWLELPVPQQIEYKWFANGEKIPVMTIITQDIGGETITTVEFKDKSRDFASMQSSELEGFEVYPNPTSNELNISLNAQVMSLSLIDISGKLIWLDNKPDLNKSIQLDGLNNGVYILKAETVQGVLQKRIVKK
jgi:hypothetical protein